MIVAFGVVDDGGGVAWVCDPTEMLMLLLFLLLSSSISEADGKLSLYRKWYVLRY